MQNSSQDYKYQQLKDHREIRLLELQRGGSNDGLEVKIVHTSLDSSPKFLALSYVWGPQHPSRTLDCGSGQTSIGLNLFHALTRIRSESSELTLWVDRISIDQSNLDERGKQVQIMGAIFGSAEEVVVWLGEEDSTTALAFQTLKDLVMQQLVEARDHGDTRSAGIHDVKYPNYESDSAAALRNLLARPWFTRIWAYQEIVLSRKAILLCGTHQVTWIAFKTFIVVWQAFSFGQHTSDNFLRGIEEAALQMVKVHQYYSKQDQFDAWVVETNLSLVALLQGLRNYQATDPRDKVFALLNVTSDKDCPLVPDYHQAPVEVFATCVKWIRKKQGKLAFLALVEKKDKPDLVSWVPDFRAAEPLNFTHQPDIIARADKPIWTASGFATAFPSDPLEPLLHLKVRGISLGKIVARTEPAGNLTKTATLGPNVLDGGQWHRFAGDYGSKYLHTGENIDLVFHRMRIWDILPGKAMDRRRRKKALVEDDISQPGTVKHNDQVNIFVMGDKNDIAFRILSSTTRKRMFRTDSGYLGIARRCLEVGDELFVLMGLDTPCVLRNVGGNFYSFGGEAYVHGAMDGEVLLRASGRRKKDEAIVMVEDYDKQWLEALSSLDWTNWPFPTSEITLV